MYAVITTHSSERPKSRGFRNPLASQTARRIGSMFLLLVCVATQPGHAQDRIEVETTAAATPEKKVAEKKFKRLPPLGKPWQRIGEGRNKVWVNQETKQVAVDGEVCLTKGYLEMFACILGTKEHESVVALHSKAFVIHTGLLAVGAVPGSPAQWRPNYQPAHGPKVTLEMEWQDEAGELKRMNAKKWVRDLKTKKEMTHDWVFAGSLFWVDPETKKQFYRAEGGEIACVSNFPVAMLDLPIESSESNGELTFEAFTENIPMRRTPLRMYLTPEKAEEKQN